MPVLGKKKVLTGLAALLPAVTAAAVVAAPSPAMAAATCYNHDGNVTGTYTRSDGLDQRVPSSGNLLTTSYCNDINLYVDADTISPDYPYLMACVVFVRHTDQCSNGNIPVGPGWNVIATDVKDGSAFIVKVRGFENDPDARGTKFKLAF